MELDDASEKINEKEKEPEEEEPMGLDDASEGRQGKHGQESHGGGDEGRKRCCDSG